MLPLISSCTSRLMLLLKVLLIIIRIGIIDNHSHSNIPSSELNNYDIREHIISDIFDYYSFSKYITQTYFVESFIELIEAKLFQFCKRKLDCVVLSFENSVQDDFELFLEKLAYMESENIFIDMSFNRSIYEKNKEFLYGVDEYKSKSIELASEKILSNGKWFNAENATIYVDSKKGSPCFVLSPDFIIFKEDLPDEELVNIFLEPSNRDENGQYYLSRLPGFPMKYDEALRYLKNSKFKIIIRFITIIPKRKFGFYSIHGN